MPVEPLALCDRVLGIVGNRAEALVAATTGDSALTRFANSVIHQNVAEEETSVFVSLIVEGRPASAATTQLDDASLQRLVDRTLDAARLRPADPDWPGLAPPAPVTKEEHWDGDTVAASPYARAEVVKAFVESGAGLDAAGYCSTTGVRQARANSAGQRVEGRYTTATINGIQRTGVADGAATQSSVRLAELNGAAAGTEAAVRARAGVEAIDLDPGTYEVVLGPSCLASMLQFLCMYGFNAKPYLDGTSFVHLGERQFDDAVSIWDDATDLRTLGLLFDNEATPCRRIDLVAAGVSGGLAYDRRTAAKAGTESTGHSQGVIGGYPTNLFFGSGQGSMADRVGAVDRGLLVHDFWYTRVLDPKTQVVTGLTRNGVFLIENGEVGPAVKNLRFTQSFVAALGPGKVLGVADDARLVGGMHVPSVHLASWNFTGGTKG